MIFFELRSKLSFAQRSADNNRFSIQALLNAIMSRPRQRRKLTLLLVACLCLGTPAHANLFSPLLDAISPIISITKTIYTKKTDNDSNSKSNNEKGTSDKNNSENANQTLTADNMITSLPSTAVLQPAFNETINEPSLYALLDAEFAADRGNVKRALRLYKEQSFKEDATAVFERALSLSLRNEDVSTSLQFAKTWQDQNPDHIPAWFYVAHLALKAHDYALAGESLNRILSYDPRADLSEILIGIYPNNDDDKRKLLAALQPIDSEENASLSVLKAGLLYQFNEPQVALVHINRALMRQPDYVPFITLKADILRKTEPSEVVINYVSQARLRNPDSKSLYLYEIRYLLDLKQSKQAWELLLDAHNRFTDDAEITLLAALVSLDIEEYRSADQLLNMLAKSPAYLGQSYYYLGISAVDN